MTSTLIADAVAAGGIDAWFEQQLVPSSIPDDAAETLWTWFPALGLTPLEKWERSKAGIEPGPMMMIDLANWIMLRRLLSKRSLEEMMVDFWSNLLHVASTGDQTWVFRVEYEEMIRARALGRFDDLLLGAIEHPAMGMYLNNVESTAYAINENLGRELLECHTIGLGLQDEGDVSSSVRILTGFHVDRNQTWEASYIPSDHWLGRIKVLTFSSANSKPDGRPALKAYLSYLAHHPATAERLCSRLAVRFVSDNPSQELIDSLAQVYLESDTEIVPVLRALVASEEFTSSLMQKVRTPVEDAVATWAALDVTITQPRVPLDAGNQFAAVSRSMGQVVYDWPTPDAFPDIGKAWTGDGRMLASMAAHWAAANGPWPAQGITARAPMSWMPQLPTTFDHVVDNVVRTVLFLECTSTMLKAACLATDIKPTDVIDEHHSLILTDFPRLMVSILDTPEHLSR